MAEILQPSLHPESCQLQLQIQHAKTVMNFKVDPQKYMNGLDGEVALDSQRKNKNSAIENVVMRDLTVIWVAIQQSINQNEILASFP